MAGMEELQNLSEQQSWSSLLLTRMVSYSDHLSCQQEQCPSMLALWGLSPLTNRAGSRTQKSKQAQQLEESNQVPPGSKDRSQDPHTPSSCVTVRCVLPAGLSTLGPGHRRKEEDRGGFRTQVSEYGPLPISVQLTREGCFVYVSFF